MRRAALRRRDRHERAVGLASASVLVDKAATAERRVELPTPCSITHKQAVADKAKVGGEMRDTRTSNARLGVVAVVLVLLYQPRAREAGLAARRHAVTARVAAL
jgi:hypothetical protein